jgi:hypothetical protein
VSFFNTDYATNQMIDEAWWGKQPPYKDPKQEEIKFFFPLTEQIPLGLDYNGCEKPKISVPFSDGLGLTTTISNTTWSTNISPTLSVQPTNSVGQLNIGGIQIGMEKQPTWYQKIVYKLLGFNWKDK